NQTLQLSANPNPCRDQMVVDFSLTLPGLVTLNIYDVTGTKRKAEVKKNLSPGGHDMSVDISTLPSGIYFLQLAGAGQLQTIRITKE
ncbi:MAG TPA: T9SS type A sorting domain-containing protein, partial [Cyclobacteriaceae bacterium]|nr:T9SS type A sorting domain-containing protein [Cyclobacteriaceae bacterium]